MFIDTHRLWGRITPGRSLVGPSAKGLYLFGCAYSSSTVVKVKLLRNISHPISQTADA